MNKEKKIVETDYLKLLSFIDEDISIINNSKNIDILYQNHKKEIDKEIFKKAIHAYDDSRGRVIFSSYENSIVLETRRLNLSENYLVKIAKGKEHEKKILEDKFKKSTPFILRFSKDTNEIEIAESFKKALKKHSKIKLNQNFLDILASKDFSSHTLEVVKEALLTKESREVSLEYQESYYPISVIPEIDFEQDQAIGVFLSVGKKSKKYKNKSILKSKDLSFKSIIDKIPETVCRYNLNAQRIYLNKNAVEVLGKPLAKLLYSRPTDYPGGEAGQHYQEAIQHIIVNRQTRLIEMGFQHPQKKTDLLLKLIPEYDKNGNMVSVLSLGEDIKRIKKHQEKQELEGSQPKSQKIGDYQEQSSEIERKRIAREIHDELGQRLTAMKLSLQSLQMNQDSPISVQNSLSNISMQLQNAISFTQNLVSQLRPNALDLGLPSALGSLVEDFNKISTNCFFQFSTNCYDTSLSEEISINIFRIVQEALTNITKHSDATHADVNLLKIEGNLELSIRDNGCGFSVENEKSTLSFGLIGIKERALQISGAFHIESKANQGTSLTLKIAL